MSARLWHRSRLTPTCVGDEARRDIASVIPPRGMNITDLDSEGTAHTVGLRSGLSVLRGSRPGELGRAVRALTAAVGDGRLKPERAAAHLVICSTACGASSRPTLGRVSEGVGQQGAARPHHRGVRTHLPMPSCGRKSARGYSPNWRRSTRRTRHSGRTRRKEKGERNRLKRSIRKGFPGALHAPGKQGPESARNCRSAQAPSP